MTQRAQTNAKIFVLNAEMDEIHYANSLYWNQGNIHSKAAKAEYEWRQERLEKIRAELALLRLRMSSGSILK